MKDNYVSGYQVATEKFESMVCGNCKHHDDTYCNNQKVDEMMDEFQEMTNYIRVENTFGCNKWESK